MKTLSQNLVTTLIILMVIISENSNAQIITTQKTTQTIGYDLPFLEDWHWGDFETNQWQTDSDNWQIDTQTGNDAPTAKFHRTPILTNYSRTLTSNVLNGNLLNVGRIFLLFDLKLTDNNENGSELFSIQIFDGSNWNTIDSLSNDGSFDWTNYSYDISNWAIGNEFKIRFRASGEQSMNIIDWYIDNIEIYRESDRPLNLMGDLFWNHIDDYGVEIVWDAPESVFPVSVWKHWDSGQNFSGIGLNNGGDFYAAIRWNTGSLSDIDGDTIRSIRFFPNDDGFEYFIIKIWTDENAANLIYSDTAQDVVNGVWNEHQLNETIIIDESLEYWVGYKLVGQTIGSFPAGYDSGPAIAGYGDLIMIDDTWDNLSDFGLDYNWNIQMFINSEANQNPENLIGFNIFRKFDTQSEYSKLGYTEFNEGQESFSYYDQWNSYPCCGGYYKVNALWGKNGDTCTSNFAFAHLFPDDDFVYVVWQVGTEEISHENALIIYPNPTYSALTIKSENQLENINIYNMLGQRILNLSEIKENELLMDVSILKTGIYFIKIETNNGTITKKLIKK